MGMYNCCRLLDTGLTVPTKFLTKWTFRNYIQYYIMWDTNETKKYRFHLEQIEKGIKKSDTKFDETEKVTFTTKPVSYVRVIWQTIVSYLGYTTILDFILRDFPEPQKMGFANMMDIPMLVRVTLIGS